MSATRDPEVIWHEVECGGYSADLAIWDELAGAAAGPVLELGAGAGRVALHLAAQGREVTAVDRSPALLAELGAEAAARGLDVESVAADVADLELGRRFAAVFAPMQFMHLFVARERAELCRAVARHLRPGGTFAAALLAEDAESSAQETEVPPLPDVREHEGWVYSSLPVAVRSEPAGYVVSRLRQVVSPAGELSETTDDILLARLNADGFEAEAAGAGLVARERIAIAPTADHVGSVVCVMEASR